ncbi:hypothetical protein AB0F17_60050 [Nonomuraea sp. NPDC026600]|uniref:hypothetical protein n=1 Tax=Nonomuraea sp. NPDC026600 TaxID=3155363 RepID=UPI0033D9297F
MALRIFSSEPEAGPKWWGQSSRPMPLVGPCRLDQVVLRHLGVFGAVLALGLGADALAASVGAFTAGLLQHLINR